MNPRWRRSALVWPDSVATFGDDDWTLIGAAGERRGRIYNARRDDGHEPGDWRWRVYRANGIDVGGSAESGADAKKIVEGLINKN
jgi:hypothetical protein